MAAAGLGVHCEARGGKMGRAFLKKGIYKLGSHTHSSQNVCAIEVGDIRDSSI